MSEESAEYSTYTPPDTVRQAGLALMYAKEILPCQLATHELIEKGRDLEAELARRDEIERERKAAADGFKEQIEEQAAKIRDLRKCIRTQQEERPVTVCVTRDYRRGQVLRTREDTGELLSERAMTPDERQQEMPL